MVGLTAHRGAKSRRLGAFAHTELEQGGGAEEPVRIERTRVQVEQAVLALRLDEVDRLTDMETLIAIRPRKGG